MTLQARATAVVAALAVLGAVGATPRPSPPPPTPAPPSGSPSPFPTVLETPKSPERRPAIRAAAAVLASADTGQVLVGKDRDARRPIASLTKIMTALLVLERSRLEDVVRVSDRAVGQTGSVLGLRRGERIAVRDLLYGLLLQSSNDAAVALAEHVGGTVEGFVEMMNRRARELGLADTRFYSASGLDDRGYSTAGDLVRLTRRSFGFPAFARIVRSRFRTIPAPAGPPRRIQNRNVLLWLYRGAIGVKTGFTTPAGFCVVAAAERRGRRLVAVVLGAPGEAFSDAAALLDHGFAGFVRREVLRAGQVVGRATVGEEWIPALAARDATRLIPEAEAEVVERRFVPLEELRLPVETGEAIGHVHVVVGGGERTVAEVPAVAAWPLERGAGGEGGRANALETLVARLAVLLRAAVAPYL